MTPRTVHLCILGISMGALGLAYGAQFGFGLEPCILCLYQRIPYGVTAALALAALSRPGRPWRRPLTWLAALAFAVGAAIAFYHVGVEQHWWVSAASCGGTPPEAMTAQSLMQSLQNKPPKACDEFDWALFGISMAAYNAVASAGFAAFAAWRAHAMGSDQ